MAITARKGLSKRVRFEVFKRDSFQCQYCGRKAPDVILHIDHIEPVSKGGENEILNLVTSCYDCNLGKSNKKLNDGSVIEKQRKQLELLQEKREQMKLMLEWKKSLSKLDDKTLEMVKKHAEEKARSYTLNENGQNTLRLLIKKYPVEKIIDAINISAIQYLKYSNDGEIIKESVENYINKLGGILFNQNLKPIDQKIALIKNKIRSGFNYSDPRKASILLNLYVTSLRKHWEYTDEQIIEDLEKELLPKTEESQNWSSWVSLIEGWIESVKKPKEEEKNEDDLDFEIPDFTPINRTPEELEGSMNGRKYELESNMKALIHILKPFPNFDENKFNLLFYKGILAFIKEVRNIEEKNEKGDDTVVYNQFIQEIILSDSIIDLLKYDVTDGEIDGSFLDNLQIIYEFFAERVLKEFNFSIWSFTSDNMKTMREFFIKYFEEKIKK